MAEHPALEGVDLSQAGKQIHSLLLATPSMLIAGEGYGGEAVLRALDKRNRCDAGRAGPAGSSGGIGHELPAPRASVPGVHHRRR